MRNLLKSLPLLSLVLLASCSREPATEPVEKAESAAPPVASAEPAIDPVTGFKMGGDWELVRANCTSCHSAKLVTQQRGTPQQWLSMIRWMQATQNLWQFDPDTESRIVAYLSEYYAPDEARRRAAIPRDLMPPNPYAAATPE